MTTVNLIENPSYIECRRFITLAKEKELINEHEQAKELYLKAIKTFQTKRVDPSRDDNTTGSIQAHQSYALLSHRNSSTLQDLIVVERHYKLSLASMDNFINMQSGETLVDHVWFAEEQEASVKAQDKLGLLLCQSNPPRESEVNSYLSSLGFCYRLSPEVLNYSIPPQIPNQKDNNRRGDGNYGSQEYDDYFKIIDNVLPPKLLNHLQNNFSPKSNFWPEHFYGTSKTGYFSYLFKIGDKPSNTIEQMINYFYNDILLKQSPEKAKEVKYAEWWAHSRPHCFGHQLHYDSDDEGRDGVLHPTFSSVMYVTGEVGGPTLMTNQTLKGKHLADRGWLIHPVTNRFVLFDGNVLHGVIPGRGVCTDRSADDDDNSVDPNNKSFYPPTTIPPSTQPRRMTLMTAFWKDIKCRPRDDKLPGSSQPFPTKDSHPHYTWIDDFPVKDSVFERKDHDPQLINGKPVILDNVWTGIYGKKLPKYSIPHYELCFQGF